MLILGGTGFIGPHMTELALARGWKVTHFNRGKRDADGVENVETLHGDRKGQLDSLKGRKWDVGRRQHRLHPEVREDVGGPARAEHRLLPLHLEHLGLRELREAERHRLADRRAREQGPGRDHERDLRADEGALRAVRARCLRRALARSCAPATSSGPLDPTDRFTYWPVRVAKGGDMAVPGTPADPIQIVDVRDLVAFMLGLVDRRVDGDFNAVTPPGAITMGELMDTSQKVTGADTKFTWIDEDFLAANMKPEEMNFAPWGPMQGAEAGGSLTGMAASQTEGLQARVRSRKSCATRSPGTRRGRPSARRTLRSGFTPEREAEILALWRARPGSLTRAALSSARAGVRCRGEEAASEGPAMRTVRQLLDGKTPGVVTVDAADPVRTAIERMAEHFIGALPVLEDGRLAGIVSERDYARKVVLMGRKSTETKCARS